MTGEHDNQLRGSEGADPGCDFQARVEEWLEACFSGAARTHELERSHRFVEEAIELAQASGCTASEVHVLVDYVFSRPQGQREQEAGGALVTLAALCSASGVRMMSAGERELRRNWQRIDLIRAKRAVKLGGTPLP